MVYDLTPVLVLLGLKSLCGFTLLRISMVYPNQVCQPHYDSLLVKVSVSGTTYEVARRKMLRALVEFRIRGVKVGLVHDRYFCTHSCADQYSVPVPSADERRFHWWKDMDHS
jgi:pyruvate carboxylase